MDFEQLAASLDAGARLRLWLLRTLVERVPPDQALDYALKMEEFVTRPAAPARCAEVKAPTNPSGIGHDRGVDAVIPAEERYLVPDKVRDDSAETLRERPNGAGVEPSSTTGRLVAGGDRLRLERAVESGASNAELAEIFKVTLRQANCLRLSLLRSKAATRRKSNPAQKEHTLTRELELSLQDEFLRNKLPVEQTMDDVVRFLRQRGDVVFQADGNYAVNGRMTLTAEQLVERANRQCAASGRPAFHIPDLVAASTSSNKGSSFPNKQENYMSSAATVAA
jgi:hypothetical protein